MMSQSALYQLSRYAYENNLTFSNLIARFLDPVDPFYPVENSELERRIKEFICEAKKK